MYVLSAEERQLIDAAGSFKALAEIAHASLSRMRQEHTVIIQICGPMSSGGLGNLEANMARFNRAVQIAVQNGLSVFNQVHYQEAMVRILEWKPGDPYSEALLEDFYGEIFAAGHINKGIFLPDWQTSYGSRWEWERFRKLSIPVEDYPQEWLHELLS